MATRIKLRRDTATRWENINPILSLGEPGLETDTGKIKYGDGLTTWNLLPYFDDQTMDLSAIAQDIIPDEDNTYNLGSPAKQWKELFVSGGSIYLGDIKLTNNSGQLVVQQVTDPGEETEAPVPGTPGSVTTDRLVNGEHEFTLDAQGVLRLDGEEFTGGGGGGLGSITVPGEAGSTYKGLQVAYGRIHSNSSSSELNVSKIVIHQPAASTVTIDPSSSQDDFQVSGLGDSDVLAMFVIYGDVNAAKPLSELEAFAQAVIDNVILINGEEGVYQTLEAMKTSFASAYGLEIGSAVGGLDVDFEFYTDGISTWPENSIGDGGNDQYDTANYISTNLATNIQYNGGNTVADGTAAFGAGSAYSFVYQPGIFGLFVTGNGAAYVRTSGNSGADGSSTTDSGHIYGPDTLTATYDNAVTHINIVGDTWAGPIVTFVHADDSDTVDILIPDDGEGAGVGITRNSNNGIYNPYREGTWDDTVSPGGTLWNIDGWTDLTDIESRTYTPLYEAFGFGGLGNKIVGTECVMFLPDNGKYYAVKFDSWTQGGGGGFAYTRREIDTDNLQTGIRFSDGTRLASAEGLGRVKLSSPGGRRIEETYGYKQVSVTPRDRQEITGATYTNVNAYELRVKKSTEIDAFIGPYYNTGTTATWYISFDNITFRAATLNSDGGDNWMFYYVSANDPTLQVEDAPFYIRRDVGGEPVVWWDRADLPGGSGSFRGAVIDYHAYTTESTIIGTIHIVDDDGEEHITHTEVSSGSTDSENDDLWVVQNEGTISYRRIDGESKSLKIQWAAKVFYGTEIYD